MRIIESTLLDFSKYPKGLPVLQGNLEHLWEPGNPMAPVEEHLGDPVGEPVNPNRGTRWKHSELAQLRMASDVHGAFRRTTAAGEGPAAAKHMMSRTG